IRIGNTVQIYAFRSAGKYRPHSTLSQLALQRSVPGMCIRSLDVGVDNPRAHLRKRKSTAASGQRTEVGIRDRSRHSQHCVVGRILNQIESHITEITLVTDAVTAAKAGLAVAEYVPCETHSRTEVCPARF